MHKAEFKNAKLVELNSSFDRITYLTLIHDPEGLDSIVGTKAANTYRAEHSPMMRFEYKRSLRQIIKDQDEGFGNALTDW